MARFYSSIDIDLAELGWSRKHMAQMLGRRPHTVQNWCEGRCRPPPEVRDWLRNLIAALESVPVPILPQRRAGQRGPGIKTIIRRDTDMMPDFSKLEREEEKSDAPSYIISKGPGGADALYIEFNRSFVSDRKGNRREDDYARVDTAEAAAFIKALKAGADPDALDDILKDIHYNLIYENILKPAQSQPSPG